MYDSSHQVIVDNKPLYSITYTPPKGTQAEDRLELAEKLAKYISMESDKVTERNKKEYWYLKNKKKAGTGLWLRHTWVRSPPVAPLINELDP